MTELDISTIPDLDPLATWISGPQAIAERVARRFLTRRGALWYDPDFGLDLRDFLNAGLTVARASGLRSLVGTECEKDECVTSADAEVSWDPASGVLGVHVELETNEGSATLTLAIDKVNAAIVRVD